jgi:hypothetical protein
MLPQMGPLLVTPVAGEVSQVSRLTSLQSGALESGRGICRSRASLKGGEEIVIDIMCQWNSALGRMTGKAIYLFVTTFEGVEDGQALLLLFQRCNVLGRLTTSISAPPSSRHASARPSFSPRASLFGVRSISVSKS